VLTCSTALSFLTYVTIAPITSTIRDIPTRVVLDVSDGMKRRPGRTRTGFSFVVIFTSFVSGVGRTCPVSSRASPLPDSVQTGRHSRLLEN